MAGAGGVLNTANLGGSATDSGPTAIVGLQWRLPLLILRADYELFDMNAGSAATLNVGVSWDFRRPYSPERDCGTTTIRNP